MVSFCLKFTVVNPLLITKEIIFCRNVYQFATERLNFTGGQSVFILFTSFTVNNMTCCNNESETALQKKGTFTRTVNN